VRLRVKLTIDSQVVYEKSIGIEMNDLDLCLEVYQSHINHCVTFGIK